MYVLRESILHKLNNVRSWHRADKLPELKVCYEREADINRAKDLCIMDDLFFALEPVKRTSIFGR